ncbi:TonB-dependent receptor family protein, partial [Saprospiraceae bacterium]|nr:TonB-dependent receptor family protein [Saprospiraceae bacterium]
MKILQSTILLLLITSLSAQNSVTTISNEIQLDDIIIYSGTVKEVDNDLPIGFANVALYENGTDAFVTGTTTEINGHFELQTTNKNVYLTISFVGYKTTNISEFELIGTEALFGDIMLSEEGAILDEIVVSAERSSTEFRTDRRIFNVGSDLTSSGASALEVLNNVPSVNVDIEGAVTLRGSSGVQILINGKPSVLADEESGALGNITADMIDKVEVITNPSAKYEAEGTAGIINIVLKKNESKALSGSVTLNTGTPDSHSVGLSLNKRTEKFNLFSQMGVGYRKRASDVINTTTDLLANTSLNSEGVEERNERYYNFVLGTDYYINPKNIITLSGSYTYEQEDQPSFTTFNFFDGQSLDTWTRSEATTASNPKYQYELQYKREFNDNKDHQLVFSAIGNYFSKDQSSVFTEELIAGNKNLSNQLTATEFSESKYTYNLDYTRPLSDKMTIETGVQYVDNVVRNDYQVQDLVGNEFVTNAGLTNVFDYDQKVLGAYATGAYEYGKWGFKAGARVEQTDLSTFLATTEVSNEQSFLDLFPSAHLSYKVNDRISLQGSYSSRIYRPRLWDLNPFFNIRNDFSIRTGNPLLAPEYTDSYEIGSVFIYDNITFNVNAYQRTTTDKIEYISSFEDNVRIYSPQNVGTSDTKGLELNFKYTPLKSVTINGDMNYNYFTREGIFDEQNFDFSNDQWNTKLTTKYKVN